MHTYNMLDLMPKGRDERDVEYKMEWVRHHDRYESAPISKRAVRSRSCTVRSKNSRAIDALAQEK